MFSLPGRSPGLVIKNRLFHILGRGGFFVSMLPVLSVLGCKTTMNLDDVPLVWYVMSCFFRWLCPDFCFVPLL